MKKLKSNLKYYLIAPTVIIIASLVLYPIFRTFIFSLNEFNLIYLDETKFIGFDNYIKIFKDVEFYNALKNTIFIVGLVVIISMISSLVVAMLLNAKNRLSGFLTAVAIIPWALPPILNGIIWRFIFYSGYGMMNKLLIVLNLIDEPILWVANKTLFILVISIVVSWRVVPFSAIIILANLQSIPNDLYMAAKIDGAGNRASFRHITLPLIMPSLAIVLTNITVNTVNIFDEIVAIAGYSQTTQNLMLYDYIKTFSFLDFGYGSAVAYVIMLFSGVFGYFYVKSMVK